jgi:hypothetical protein
MGGAAVKGACYFLDENTAIKSKNSWVLHELLSKF